MGEIMSIKIIPYNREILTSFRYNGLEKELSGEDIIPIIDFYSGLGSIYMGLIDGKVIGLGGVYPLWENSGGCFLFLNEEARNYKKSVFKTLREYMAMLIKKYQIKNLVIECVDGKEEAHRLIEHLGFKKDKNIKMARYIKIGV